MCSGNEVSDEGVFEVALGDCREAGEGGVAVCLSDRGVAVGHMLAGGRREHRVRGRFPWPTKVGFHLSSLFLQQEPRSAMVV